MKFFTKLTSALFMAAMALPAGAQSLGEGMVINPYPPTEYQTFLAAVTVAYDFKIITLTTQTPSVVLNIDGEDFIVDADVYFDPEIAWELGQTNSDPAWGNELVIDFSEEVYKAGYPVGEYTISIPAGLVADEEGNTNAAQTIVFKKVDTTPPMAVTPPDGTYDYLPSATVTFEAPISEIRGGGQITARKKNDWLGDPIYLSDYSIDGKVLTIDLGRLEHGVLYSVNVPEGFVVMNEFYINEEIWMEYMIWDGMEPATILSAPAPETSLDLSPFILTWDYQTITLPDGGPDTEFVCGFPDYGMQDGWRMYIPPKAYKLVHVDRGSDSVEEPTDGLPANALYLDVSEWTDGWGGYQFEIFFPAELVFNSNDMPNPPMSYVFTVRNLWPAPEVTADAGVINMAWPEVEWATYNLADEEVTLYNGETGKTITLGFTFGHTVEGEVSLVNEGFHGLEIDLNGTGLADGNYTLTVPQGYIVLEGAYGEFVLNGEVTYCFGWKDGAFAEYDGMGSIMNSSGSRDIYDIQGRKVRAADGLQSLPRGIYIVGGKKILVK